MHLLKISFKMGFFFLFFFCPFVSQEAQCLGEQHESCSVREYMLGSKLLWHILYQLFLCDRNQWIKIRSYLPSRSERWRTEGALLIHVMGYWLWPQGEYICRHRMTLYLHYSSSNRTIQMDVHLYFLTFTLNRLGFWHKCRRVRGLHNAFCSH